MNQMPKMTKEKFNETKEKIKDLLKKISKTETGIDIQAVKGQFKDLLSNVNPLVIAAAESDLVSEGFTQDDLITACDIHLELFREQIENPELKVPKDHPIYTFQQEHKAILHILQKLSETITQARKKNNFDEAHDEIALMEKIVKKIMEAESHNIRQENTLFPILERHGVEQPPAIMWTEHHEMKEQKKELLKLLKERDNYDFRKFLDLVNGYTLLLIEKFGAHTQKEEYILYEIALEVITDDEWRDIKEECDNLGYFELEIE